MRSALATSSAPPATANSARTGYPRAFRPHGDDDPRPGEQHEHGQELRGARRGEQPAERWEPVLQRAKVQAVQRKERAS
jgi:hypothetical protein